MLVSHVGIAVVSVLLATAGILLVSRSYSAARTSTGVTAEAEALKPDLLQHWTDPEATARTLSKELDPAYLAILIWPAGSVPVGSGEGTKVYTALEQSTTLTPAPSPRAGDTGLAVGYATLRRNGRFLGVTFVGQPVHPTSRLDAVDWWIFGALLAAALSVGVLTAHFVRRRLTRPLQALVANSVNGLVGRPVVDPPGRLPDEVAVLWKAVDEAVANDRRATQRQLDDLVRQRNVAGELGGSWPNPSEDCASRSWRWMFSNGRARRPARSISCVRR